MSFFAEARFISSDWVVEVDDDDEDDPAAAAAAASEVLEDGNWVVPFERDDDDDDGVHDFVVVVAALDDDDSSSILESPSVLFGLSLFIEFRFWGTFRRAKRHRCPLSFSQEGGKLESCLRGWGTLRKITDNIATQP